jgi:hypothetical protein
MALIYSYPLADEVTNDSWVLGSEMENGARIVKNYSVGDLASFTRGFVTLNDVLDNDNVSQIDAKVGGIFLYNSHLPSGLGYPYITGDKNRFNFYNNVDEYYGNLSQDTLSLANAGDEYYLSIMKPVAVTENRTVTFQDADGTVALTDDLLDYVPYTGATGSINIGENEILTSSVSKLSGSGGVYGGELYIYDFSNEEYGYISLSDSEYFLYDANNRNIITMSENGIVFDDNSWRSSISTGTITGNRTYTLPNASGTIALTTDIPTPAYKVYTALLTQTGANAPAVLSNSNLTIGVTYQIKTGSTGPFDFTNVGAINNNIGTSFVATGTTPNNWASAALNYNAGAPVVTVLENTLGGDIIWTYEGTGEYLGTLAGAFINNKTYFSGLADQSTQLKVLRLNNNVVNVGTGISGVKTNGALNVTTIEIRVYN